MNRPRILVTAAALLLGAALIASPPAMAGHSNAGSAGDPDNGDHYLDRNSLTTSGDTAAVWGVNELNRAGDMNATFTGSGDVEIYDSTYGDTGWAGLTSCQSGYNYINGNCDIFKVQFNQSAMTGLSLDYWRSLGCHELGHTAGLGHRAGSNDSDNNSCMRENIWPRSYDGHDIDAINSAV